MARAIDQQPAPWETRAILDLHCRDAETLRIQIHQLQQGLHPAQDADGSGRLQAGLRRGHHQPV
jgi:hypothetical protein